MDAPVQWPLLPEHRTTHTGPIPRRTLVMGSIGLIMGIVGFFPPNGVPLLSAVSPFLLLPLPVFCLIMIGVLWNRMIMVSLIATVLCFLVTLLCAGSDFLTELLLPNRVILTPEVTLLFTPLCGGALVVALGCVIALIRRLPATLIAAEASGGRLAIMSGTCLTAIFILAAMPLTAWAGQVLLFLTAE